MQFVPLFHRPPGIVNTNPLGRRHSHPNLLFGLLIIIFLHHKATSLLAYLKYKLVEIHKRLYEHLYKSLYVEVYWYQTTNGREALVQKQWLEAIFS